MLAGVCWQGLHPLLPRLQPLCLLGVSVWLLWCSVASMFIKKFTFDYVTLLLQMLQWLSFCSM